MSDPFALTPADFNTAFKIFFPHAQQRVKEVDDKKLQFVHYTTAEAATNIFKTKQLWMRLPSCMNDFSEVEYGLKILNKIYSNETVGKAFREMLNSIHKDVTLAIEDVFNNTPFNPRIEHYITSISEYPPDETGHGKLSMWRAYGQKSGVALVLNPETIIRGPGTLELITSPVGYFSESDFEIQLQKIILNMEEHIDYLKGLSREKLILFVSNTFRFAALSIKHVGFDEEREWRLIYSPKFANKNYIKADVEVVAGVPQTIYKIPLSTTECGKITGSELDTIIDRVIIGPTQYPTAVRNAFIKLMTDAKISNPESKVFISETPLRT